MIKFSKNRTAKKAQCRLKINSKPCKNIAGIRGLCRSCYTHLQRRGLLDKYGLRRKDKVFNYTLDRSVLKGICRVKVNGENCAREASCRGLCRAHYTKFRLLPEGRKFMLKRKIKGKDY